MTHLPTGHKFLVRFVQIRNSLVKFDVRWKGDDSVAASWHQSVMGLDIGDGQLGRWSFVRVPQVGLDVSTFSGWMRPWACCHSVLHTF